MRAIAFLLLLPALGFSQQISWTASPQSTLFVDCRKHQGATRVLSPASVSEDGIWRAYIEVDFPQCLTTTRLWVGERNSRYRVVYLMPPEPDTGGNGMEILGWAPNSRVVLAVTERWPLGDADDTQGIVAIDAGNGMLYEPYLNAMLEARKDKRCWYRVTAAGFATEKSTDILVRARFFTHLDVDETETDVPPEQRCEKTEETWSFDFDHGQVRQVPNTQPMQLYKRLVPERRKR